MATARKLIYDGLREGNLIPANAALSATDVQNAEMLPLLNNALFTLLGEVIGEEPRDWAVPPRTNAPETPYWNESPFDRNVEQQPVRYAVAGRVHQYPPVNSRLVVSLTEADTVYLPPAPDDGALISIADLDSQAPLTLDGNGRFINDAASITLDPVSSYNSGVFMYRADRGGWYPLTEMGIDDASPLPTVFDQLLSIELYIRAAPRFGSTPAPASLSVHKQLRNKLKRRYKQNQPIIAPAKGPTLSRQEYQGVFYRGR